VIGVVAAVVVVSFDFVAEVVRGTSTVVAGVQFVAATILFVLPPAEQK